MVSERAPSCGDLGSGGGASCDTNVAGSDSIVPDTRRRSKLATYEVWHTMAVACGALTSNAVLVRSETSEKPRSKTGLERKARNQGSPDTPVGP